MMNRASSWQCFVLTILPAKLIQKTPGFVRETRESERKKLLYCNTHVQCKQAQRHVCYFSTGTFYYKPPFFLTPFQLQFL